MNIKSYQKRYSNLNRYLFLQIDHPSHYHNIPLGLENIIHWKLNPSLCAIGFVAEQFKIKWFYADENDLQQLKTQLGAKIFFANISQFWESVSVLGVGSSSQVCLIKSLTQEDKKCAAKCIQKNYINKSLINFDHNNERMEQLIQEIEIMKTLNHQNIVKLKEIYEGESSYYLIMDLMEGPSLSKFIREYPFTKIEEIKIKNIMQQILLALAYLHSKGIIHRDIKPENLIFQKPDTTDGLILIDFGLAFFQKHPQHSLCGTPGYIAPEMFTLTNYTNKVDVFSAGAIFYRLLTKKHLFEGSDTQEIIYNNEQCEYDLSGLYNLPYNPKAFLLLQQMIEPDPSQRLSVQECLNHAFFLDHKNHVFDLKRKKSSILYKSNNNGLETQFSIPSENNYQINVPRLQVEKGYMLQMDQGCIDEKGQEYTSEDFKYGYQVESDQEEENFQEDKDRGKNIYIYKGKKIDYKNQEYAPSFKPQSVQSFDSFIQ